ncbi:MAG: alpha/beta hydrolase [Chloroflexi bacterium]|nr:alpha/beta hydrolase [Chloroflexota bacterium]
MATFRRDGIQFHYIDQGEGFPVVFQHGLGSDAAQVAELLPQLAGVRTILLDSRGHGQTRPLGDPQKLNFNSLVDDVMALLDRLGVGQAVFGGISMGAGMALNAVSRYPARVLGLVLVRPAWLEQPMPDNLRGITLIGRLIRERGAGPGREEFMRSAEYARLVQEGPEAAASLLRQFEDPYAVETAVKLERIPLDAPVRSRTAWTQVRVPALVLVNDHDPVHPMEMGRVLAAHIPRAELVEITSKSVSPEGYRSDLRAAITPFIGRLRP